MAIKLCRACCTPLINKRSHCTTCSSKCRNACWRQSKITMIPEKIMFSTTNHQLIKNAADNNGVSIHTYIHDRAISMEYSQC